MYTQCSHCQAEYEVAPELLVRGRGWLHCSDCGQDFDALGNLTKEPRQQDVPPLAIAARGDTQMDFEPVQHVSTEAFPEENLLVEHLQPVEHPQAEERLIEEHQAEIHQAELQSPEAQRMEEQADPAIRADHVPELAEADVDWEVEVDVVDAIISETPEDAEPAPAQAEPDSTPDSATEVPKPRTTRAPSFARDRKQLPVAAVQHGRGWRLGAMAALCALLVVQVALADRARYASDARTRPWLEKLCAVLHCQLPPWREPAALHLMARDVQAHPSVPEALIISASFRNDARWPQPWPDLDLTLSDINGQPVARRQFLPDEYLGLASRELSIAPGQSASITLEVADPGKQVVAFEFDFR